MRAWRTAGLAILPIALVGAPATARTAAAPPTGVADAALAGHYYLSGVMETGSELLLRRDGRFEWYVSYGAVDQSATGRWSRDGATVTLTADAPSPDAPPIRADRVLPWDAQAERRLRDAEWSREADAVAQRCPWNDDVAATAAPLSAEAPPRPAAAAAKAAEARRTAERARDDATRAMAAALAPGAPADARAAADAAMAAWHGARDDMERAHVDAGLPAPAIGSPVAPTACAQPPRPDTGALPSTQWRRGIAALVGDPARDLRLSGVDVTFVYGDGHRETATTDRGGWAFVPRRAGTAVERLIVAVPVQGLTPVTLPVAPLAEGVQTLIVDTRQLVAPPFRTMRLTVDRDALIPATMPRGRYIRH
ncbi:hypothetical protein [Sphingomonas adhaesiva]|uniref:hypothetical protein n=1 Tax=Sphingomonas adhaesiva TaxID=28212 RepID=UPI0035C6B0ED